MDSLHGRTTGEVFRTIPHNEATTRWPLIRSGRLFFSSDGQRLGIDGDSGAMTYFQPYLAQPPAIPAGSSSLVVQQAVQNLVAVIEKYPSVDEARKEIRRRGFDPREGNSKTALELLDVAGSSWQLFLTHNGGLR